MGTIVNVITIVIGSLIGLFAKKFLKESLQLAVMTALSLCVLVIGISGALITENMLIVISCLVIGTVIGEALDIDGRLTRLSENIEKKYFKKESNFAQGFMLASCLYVIGAMAIVGSIQSGLGSHDTLYAKALLDGVSSIFLAAIYGIGVLFSSIPVAIYQGGITLAAKQLTDVLNPELITELTAVGSVMIIAIGLNTLNIVKIKVANLLPSLLIVPVIMLVIMPLIATFF